MTSTSAVRITDPGDLVAVVPCVLTFHPTESLVLLSFTGDTTRMGPVLRADLPVVGAVEAVTDEMLQVLTDDYRHSAVLVVVSTEPRDDVYRDVSLALTAAGVRVTEAIHATGTTRGHRWRCLDYGCSDAGTVPGPPTTIAEQMAWNGQVLLPNREAIEQALAPVDTATLTRRAHLLTDGSSRRSGVRPLLAEVLTDFHAHHRQLDDDLVLRLIAALADQRAVAEHLREQTSQIRPVLEALVRETPAPWSAAPAAYLALAALLHGDGAHAWTAADRAMAADPAALLSRLVVDLVGTAPSPDTVRGLLTRF